MHSAAKSRPQPPPGSQDSSLASICVCCCLVILVTVLFSVVVLAIGYILYVSMPNPKTPQVDLQQVGVQYINVANASLSLSIRMLFTAENDNDDGIKYGASTFNISYRGIPLGRGTLPGFKQPEHSVRKVEMSVTVEGVNLVPGDAAELARDTSVDDRVEFRITGGVNAKIPSSSIWGLTTNSVQVPIDCVIAISPRRQALTYKQCGLDSLEV